MTIYFALFTAIFLLGALGIPKALAKDLGTPPRPLSRDVTSTINGYFISLVFLSHLRSNIDKSAYASTDQGYLSVIGFLGQLVVATFLFYSGYGIMESITRKGQRYIYELPRKRILPYLLDVCLAIAVFLVTRTAIGKDPVSLETLLLSLIGWKSIGNSNWYIFAILCLWLFTYLSFRIFPRKNQRWRATLLVFMFTAVYYCLMVREGADHWWYDTVFCYPCGMTLSLAKDAIHARRVAVPHSFPARAAGAALLLALFLFLHEHAYESWVIFNVCAVVFALFISLCSTFFKYLSKPFLWAGDNLFYLYIYQRIPMMVLAPYLASNTFLFTTACLITLIPLVYLMKWLDARWKGFLLASPPEGNEGL